MNNLFRTIRYSILCIGFAMPGAYANNIKFAENLSLNGAFSKAANKPVVLFVTASDCPYCEILRENIFQFLPTDERFILRELQDGQRNVLERF